MKVDGNCLSLNLELLNYDVFYAIGRSLAHLLSCFACVEATISILMTVRCG